MSEEPLHSRNSLNQPGFNQLFIPTGPRLLLYLLISFLVLIFLNLQPLWNYFTNDVLGSPQSLGTAIGNAPWADKVSSVIYHGRLLQIVFWAFMGCAVYVIFWFLSSIFTNIRNDIVADEYVHPNAYNRASFWHSVIARKGFFILMIVLMIGYFVALIRFVPLLGALCQIAAESFSWYPSMVEIIWAWLSIAILLYVFDLLVHLTVNAWRLIYSDL